MTRKHRPRHRIVKPTAAQQALQAWLELLMADQVAARLAYRVVGLHAGLIAWMADAEHARLLPHPFRLPGDERVGGVSVGGMVSGTREPDDALWRRVAERLEVDWFDPERLGPTRHYLTHQLGRLAGWYLDQTETVLPERWEPLAVRLGDLIGDQVAANALATSILGHHALAITALNPSRGVCQAGRERWRRMAERYVRVLDEQPDKPPRGGRVAVQSVGLDDVRRFG